MNRPPCSICYRTALGLAALTLLALAGCSDKTPAHYTAVDITGVMPDLEFTLTNENGQQVTEADYADARLNIVFFGYTSCPDVCPITLARLSTALAGLDKDVRSDVNVLFVSVDPKRDTPKRLKKYTAHFGPQFMGLTGTQQQLTKLTDAASVSYSYGEPDKNGFYPVSHSSHIFVFDEQGDVRLLINQDETADEITADLQTLLQHTT